MNTYSLHDSTDSTEYMKQGPIVYFLSIIIIVKYNLCKYKTNAYNNTDVNNIKDRALIYYRKRFSTDICFVIQSNKNSILFDGNLLMIYIL